MAMALKLKRREAYSMSVDLITVAFAIKIYGKLSEVT